MSGPRKAGMVAVLRPQLAEDGADFALLLVRRSQRASFMANAYVFPGGRVDAADAEHDPEWPSRYAAARELFEEAGLQAATPKSLVRFAQWITPSAEPKRFDADCYLLSIDATTARHGDAVQVDGHEVFDPLWLTPREALARYQAGELNLPPPTVCTIEELEAERLSALSILRQRGELPTDATLQTASQLVFALIASCAALRKPYPLLPKLIADPSGTGIAIVMPWDSDFAAQPGDGTSFAAMAENGPPVPRRISRCILHMAKADETYAVQPGRTESVRWQIERLPG